MSFLIRPLEGAGEMEIVAQRMREALLDQGEEWMRSRGMRLSRPYTSKTNFKLIRLFEKRGYVFVLINEEKLMVVLERAL